MTAPDGDLPGQNPPTGDVPARRPPDGQPAGREAPGGDVAGPDVPGGDVVDRGAPDGSPPDQDAPDRSPSDQDAVDGSPSDQNAADDGSGQPVSGLRNPVAAVRGVGAGALSIEALVLLLAIVPLHMLDVRMAGLAIGVVVGLAVLCLLLAGALRRSWAWRAAVGVQVLLIACGFFHVALAVLGVLFTAVWFYVLSVRRSVLGR
jgi:hypothetical protein